MVVSLYRYRNILISGQNKIMRHWNYLELQNGIMNRKVKILYMQMTLLVAVQERSE